MNNRGFTLIELLAVIVILGIIMALGISSYSAISSSMRESQRDNLISEIEIAASRYAYDTGETIIFVDNLVTNGYIESDDEDGNIEDPVNGGKLNCYIVEMTKASDYYDAEFIEEYNYEDSSGNCDTTILKKLDSEIVITAYDEDGDIINDTDKWLTGSVSLLATFSGSTMNCNTGNNSCMWTSTSGQEVDDTYITVETADNSILSSTYTFQYTVYTTDGVTRYTASIDLKIDNQYPNIYVDETVISDRYITTSSKTVTIVASDGNGSGNLYYYLGTGDISCNNNSLKSSYKSDNVWTISSSNKSSTDTYTLCVKDDVGNITGKTITIDYIS